MHNPQTIHQLLDTLKNYEVAFWTTYSIDFETMTTLVKNDLRESMTPCNLHVLCDYRQMGKTIEKRSATLFQNIQYLQSYSTISPQMMKGAFHPKILFLASEESIYTFIMSANMTKSGVLSNEDLIGSFHSPNAKDEIQAEIIDIFAYVASFDGWSESANMDLEAVREHFPLLTRPRSEQKVLTIPHDIPLFNQMIDKLESNEELQEINIYSPFLDDHFEAAATFGEQYKSPVNIYSPQKQFIANRREKLPDHLSFYKTTGNGRSTFHAKCYEFRFDSHSTVYWGSANCSYSGLLSGERNAEILIKSELTREEVLALWGQGDPTKSDSVEIIKKPIEKEDEGTEGITLLTSASIVGKEIHVSYKGSEVKGKLVGELNHENKVSLEIKSDDSNVIVAGIERQIPSILYLAFEGEIISNKLVVNYPERIGDRVNNTTTSDKGDLRVEESIREAFRMFSMKKSAPKKSGGQKDRKGISKRFWSMPRYNRSFGFRDVQVLKRVIEERVNRRRKRQDGEGNDKPDSKKSDPSDKPTLKKDSIRYGLDHSQAIWMSLYQYEDPEEYKRISLIRWLHGLDGVNLEILRIVEQKKIPRDCQYFHDYLYYVSALSAWIIQQDILDVEGIEESLDLIRNVQDLFLMFSMHTYLIPGRKRTKAHETDILYIKRAMYYRYLVQQRTLKIKTSPEHREAIQEVFIEAAPYKRMAQEVIQILERKDIHLLYDLPKIELIQLKGFNEPLLYLGPEAGRLKLEMIYDLPVDHKGRRIPALADPLYRDKHPTQVKSINI
ncbi:MAG: hypothetical protein H8E18_07345 [FCB group bacterium]|nr:hypothetical protein [FCB group bacterium]